MSRAAAVAVVALLVPCSLAAAPAVAPAAQPPGAAEPPLLLKPSIPPDLQALETKAEALQITSLRVAVSTSLRLGNVPKGLREFLKLFEFKIEGVETTSPPAGAFQLTLFGAHLRLRIVGAHVYLFSWGLGLHDGGRPWIELGHGVLGKLYGGVGMPKDETGATGAQRYKQLFALVNEGIAIRELGPSALYGQPVTGFEAQVEPQALRKGAGAGGGRLGGFSAAHRQAPSPPPAPKPPAPKPPATTLSVYFAASGAPVRVELATGTARVGSTVTADYPAIDFPYTIPPPPPAHVISEAELMRRFPPHSGKRTVTIHTSVQSKQ